MAVSLEKWYGLTVMNGRERRVREEILKNLDRAGYAQEVVEIVLPEQEVVVDAGTNKERRVSRPVIPGYLLLRVRRLSPGAESKILKTRDVMEFLGGNDHPTELPVSEVRGLLGRPDGKGGQGATKRADFEVGDVVKVIGGPMADFSGAISEVNDNARKVKVEIEIFGRATQVELSYNDVRRA